MSEDRIFYDAGPSCPEPLMEALLIDRERMIRVVRIALAELHARRLATPQFTGETDIVEVLRYWDEVFGWIKQHGGTDIVMMSRRT